MPPSGGPTTPEGKAISARNSLKHGLTARAILLPGESEDEWLHLRDAVVLTYLPVGPVEAALVFRIAEIQWRLARVANAEQLATLHRAEHPDFYEVPRLQVSALSPYRHPVDAPEALPPGLPAPAATRPLIRYESHLWRQHRMARRELEAIQRYRCERNQNGNPAIDLDSLPLSESARTELGLNNAIVHDEPHGERPGEK
jgi:hypothetical protein